MSGGESKVWCCKEQYCIGTWNIRSMNQGKLDVVKQEMARVSINILGICEPNWMGMGEFNSDVHPPWFSGKESACSAGDTGDAGSGSGRSLGSGKSPGSGNGNPLLLLPGESHGQRRLVGYSPWDCKESDMTEVTEHACILSTTVGKKSVRRNVVALIVNKRVLQSQK